MINPWISLQRPISRNSYTAILADTEASLNFYWAIDFFGNKIFILQLSGSVRIKGSIDEIMGIQISLDTSEDKQQLNLLLIDNSSDDMFYAVCNDLLEKTRKISNEQTAVNMLIQRLDRWRKFLKSKRRILDKRQIIGLIGELHFMKNELFPKFGIKQSIAFWQAPIQEKQDYILHDKAIEVKTRATQNKVTISSYEQLNSELDHLFLYVVTITESGKDFAGSISISDYMTLLRQEIASSDIELLSEFEELLIDYGFIGSQLHDSFYILIGESELYKVTDSFPKISLLPSGVEQLSYRVNLDLCTDFIVNTFEG